MVVFFLLNHYYNTSIPLVLHLTAVSGVKIFDILGWRDAVREPDGIRGRLNGVLSLTLWSTTTSVTTSMRDCGQGAEFIPPLTTDIFKNGFHLYDNCRNTNWNISISFLIFFLPLEQFGVQGLAQGQIGNQTCNFPIAKQLDCYPGDRQLSNDQRVVTLRDTLQTTLILAEFQKSCGFYVRLHCDGVGAFSKIPTLGAV